MPSEQAKARAAAKKKGGKGKGKKKAGTAKAPSGAAAKLTARSTTGVLSSNPMGRDIQVVNFSLTYHGMELFSDTTLELNFGRRYGLLGANGCGKSTLLTAIGERDVPIPGHIDIFHLQSEIEASDKTAIEAVMDCDEERIRLEAEAETLLGDEDADDDRLADIYERLDAMDADTAKVRAARLLHGLQFTHDMMNKATKDFSGGWRMRIALARALFVKPTMLLLDEPTNHLDLEACVWLEEELKAYDRILVLISHSHDFLNNVCTNIMHLHLQKLQYYTGNYAQFCKTRKELEENQMKRYQQEQNQIADMKEYIARFGHGSAKLARQAQSKEKVLAKMMAAGLTEAVVSEKEVNFTFPECGKIPPPVLAVEEVAFTYDNGHCIYNRLDFGIDLDSRIALVGPNGAGKSTLLKLLVGELDPTKGQVKRNGHLRIARFHQHLEDALDFKATPIEFMQKTFPEAFKELDPTRRALGRYGVTGKMQMMPIEQLSPGQRARIIFCWLSHSNPHMLMLDEPTNHLDSETIDGLAKAINDFKGGVIVVSHDFALLEQVAEEIWVCEDQKVTKWEGDIFSYKKHLKTKVMALRE